MRRYSSIVMDQADNWGEKSAIGGRSGISIYKISEDGWFKLSPADEKLAPGS